MAVSHGTAAPCSRLPRPAIPHRTSSSVDIQGRLPAPLLAFSSVRCSARVDAVSRHGSHEHATWSALAAHSPKPSSRSSSGRVSGSDRSRNAGTHRNVTLVTIPSAPREVRAQRNNSGSLSSQSSTVPSAVTSRNAVTRLANGP